MRCRSHLVREFDIPNRCQVITMRFYIILGFLSLTVSAIPPVEVSQVDTNPLGQPFKNAVLPVTPGFSPRFSLFRRQGCPNLTLLCPSGGCCSYSTSCCGNTCCASGYLCTGGTATAPCCVAIGSSTNTCGGGNVSILCVERVCRSDFSSLVHDQEICHVKESTFAVLLAIFATMTPVESHDVRHWPRRTRDLAGLLLFPFQDPQQHRPRITIPTHPPTPILALLLIITVILTLQRRRPLRTYTPDRAPLLPRAVPRHRQAKV